jgi:hypothetical protein
MSRAPYYTAAASAFAEVSSADSFITSATGKKPEFLAYPYGRTDATAQTALRKKVN